MANVQLKSDLIQMIFDLVQPVVYPDCVIDEDEYSIWLAADKKFKAHDRTCEPSVMVEAVKLLDSQLTLPEIALSDGEVINPSPVEPDIVNIEDSNIEQMTHGITQPVAEVQTETPVEFAHTEAQLEEQEEIEEQEEVDYGITVFSPTSSFLTDSSYVPTQRNMYIRNSTQEEIEQDKPIASSEDEQKMDELWGQRRTITFTSETEYNWGEPTDANSIEVRQNGPNLFFYGASVGTVSNDKPVLATTSMAAKFFGVSKIEIQDANVQGQDLCLVERSKLVRLSDRTADLETKLVTLAARFGLGDIKAPADILANLAIEFVDRHVELARQAKDTAVRQGYQIKNLETKVAELSLRPEVAPEVKPEKEIIDLEKEKRYIAYFQSSSGERRYFMLKQGKKTQYAHTSNFGKAAVLSKSDMLGHLIKLTAKTGKRFTIARIMLELQ